MGLDNELAIHASTGRSAGDQRGFIALKPKHIQDVFGILDQNAEVRIIR